MFRHQTVVPPRLVALVTNAAMSMPLLLFLKHKLCTGPCGSIVCESFMLTGNPQSVQLSIIPCVNRLWPPHVLF